jgi:hypothetical protein
MSPRSVVDALDGGEVAPGGMRALSDLIFDPSNPGCMQCRPAAIKTFDFTGLSAPMGVSVSYVVGDIAYGMIASAAVATYDPPFAYNLDEYARHGIWDAGSDYATPYPAHHRCVDAPHDGFGRRPSLRHPPRLRRRR